MTDEVDEKGRQIVGKSMLLLLNARKREMPFTLPGKLEFDTWHLEFDTALPRPKNLRYLPGRVFHLQPRSMAVLRLVTSRFAALKRRLDGSNRQSRAQAPAPHTPRLTNQLLNLPHRHDSEKEDTKS